MPDLDYLIRNMIYLRKREGLNQTKFAENIGSNRAVIASYEQRVADPSIQVVMKYCEFFKIDPYKMLYIDLEAYDKSDAPEPEFKLKKDIVYMDVNLEILKITKRMMEIYEENRELHQKLNELQRI